MIGSLSVILARRRYGRTPVWAVVVAAVVDLSLVGLLGLGLVLLIDFVSGLGGV